VHTFKHLLSGSSLVAYLLVGSGHYVVKSAKPDGRKDTIAFAASIPRKIYQYSVVPGGVSTPAELEAARRSDPVVAAHFADFGENTRITTLKEDMYVYVSYRKGNKVYYTKKKHKVCKGEVVITDGKNYARTRCANRLSKIFRPPSLAFDEPTAPQFDYVDPPSAPDTFPGDPLLSANYYDGLPDASNYAPPAQQAVTGANPGPPVPSNSFSGGPSEVIFPQFLPIGGASPGVFIAPSGQTSSGGGGGGGGGGGTVVPEPAEWPFVLGSSAILLFLGRSRIKRAL